MDGVTAPSDTLHEAIAASWAAITELPEPTPYFSLLAVSAMLPQNVDSLVPLKVRTILQSAHCCATA
ncbi:MAG: hypothetical protein EBW05_10005, partial [Betaproteobacteria bacterium]|nr:hypothetical protein [Betaproteobacteria bacterium]